MIVLIISIFVYLITVYLAWRWTHIAYYAEDGRWNELEPDIGDFIVVFIPVYNIVIFSDNPRKYKNKVTWVSRFFGKKK